MQQFSRIYSDINNLHNYLIEQNFDFSQKCLVRLFTAVMSKDEIVNTITSIKHLIPNADIVGGTSSGAIIFQSAQYEQNSVVIINTFDNILVNTAIFDWQNLSPRKVFTTLKPKFTTPNTQVNIVFSNTSGLLYDILDDFVHYSNISHPFISFVGGVAGNVGDKSYVFCNDIILENGVLAFSYEPINTKDKINFFTHTSIAADPISEFHEITAVDGNQILEIDKIPAIDWFYKYLDIANDEKITFDEFKKIAGDVHFSGFSIISNKHNDTSRCVLYDKEKFIISLFSSKMSVGSKFKVGYLNPKKVMHESFIMAGKILQENIQSLFVYSCSARKSFLKYAAGLELMPLSKNDVSGGFFLGEISNQDGKNNLYNASCCAVGFSEVEQAHFHVDTSMLLQENIEGDMKFFNKAVNKYNEIVEEFEDTSDSKFFDTDYNLPNILKYNYDVSKNIFDKIAIVEVLTADSTISDVGKDKFVETGHELFASLGKFMDHNDIGEFISYYILNYKTFIITGSHMIDDQDFIDAMSKTHEKFGFVTSKITHISAVSRLAVVLNQENMLKVGISTLYANRSSQENFFVSGKNDIREQEHLTNETFYINLLKRAIDNQNVVPYYQGMHNNKTGKIDKYEALMRIIDGDTVYMPDSFMEVAKKFKLYPEISRQMITKVLNHFEDLEETVSINVSLYDIESATFREWILYRLRKAADPSRIVIEFVETEECADLNLVREFIKDVHDAGGLIAIDDFGSGYSTFNTIINLKPDLIKIDGSIISGIVENPVNLQVMKTICYLASSMGIGTIAEFVDSNEIQKLIVENEVNHSQGYLFSVPSPELIK